MNFWSPCQLQNNSDYVVYDYFIDSLDKWNQVQAIDSNIMPVKLICLVFYCQLQSYSQIFKPTCSKIPSIL